MTEKYLCLTNKLKKNNINVFNFNYINYILLVIATIIACFGLLRNNVQAIIASKICGVSIIPFIAFVILLHNFNWDRLPNAILNCILLIIICLVISFILGFLNAEYEYNIIITPEMESRADTSNWQIDLFIAVIASFGIYYAIDKLNIIALIGLIFVITIVPGISNAGLFYGMYINGNKNIKNVDNYLDNGNNSMKIFFVNLIGMIFGLGFATYINC
jgi:hypothetical protein